MFGSILAVVAMVTMTRVLRGGQGVDDVMTLSLTSPQKFLSSRMFDFAEVRLHTVIRAYYWPINNCVVRSKTADCFVINLLDSDYRVYN